jgi:hypothetical protein
VRSPSDEPLVWREKLATYFGIPGGSLCAIDPRARRVQVYVDGILQRETTDTDDQIRVPAVLSANLTISLAELWILA